MTHFGSAACRCASWTGIWFWCVLARAENTCTYSLG